MFDSSDSDSGSNRIPLKWAGAYFVSHDGVVSRADGTTQRGMSLTQARDYAGREALAYMQDGVLVAEAVRFASDGVAASPDVDSVPYRCSALTMKAAGDISGGWYLLNADDGTRWLIHGATYARHLFSVD